MCNVKIKVGECNHDYGNIKAIVYINIHKKCISEKVRFHLIKKQFESYGAILTQEHFNRMYANLCSHDFSKH